jgi:hypothetical protein
MLKQIIVTLPNICSSYFEASLFAGIFSLTFFGFLRIGEVVQSGISDHTLEVDAICIDCMQTINNVTIHQKLISMAKKKLCKFQRILKK